VVQPVDLFVDLAANVGIQVADADGDDAAEEIEKLAAIGVPDVVVLRVVDDKRFAEEVEEGGKEELLAGQDELVAGPPDIVDEPWC
jgi:hypothetical protein